MLRTVVVDIDDKGEITQESASVVSAVFDDPEPAYIFAFDMPSVETALSGLTGHPRGTPIRIIAAFDPTPAILDAIEDGRIFAAISEDPYRNGYEGVVRVAKLCRSDENSMLPIPGYGSSCIPGRIIQNANLPDFLRQARVRSMLADRPGVSTKAAETRAMDHRSDSAERS